MGRIREPELQALAEKWSPIVTALLDQLGQQVWHPKKVRRSLFVKPQVIIRHLIEGPTQRSGKVLWSLSHTLVPSAFDDSGTLTKGEREYWLVALQQGDPPTFLVSGKETIENIPAGERALEQALKQAQVQGPKVESFYGNKGPLSHR